MTGAAFDFGFEEMADTAVGSGGRAEVVVAVMGAERLDEDSEDSDAGALINNPATSVEVGAAVTSLCATGIGVIEDTAGVVPLEAEEADVEVSNVLLEAAGVDVSIGAGNEAAGAGGGLAVVSI